MYLSNTEMVLLFLYNFTAIKAAIRDYKNKKLAAMSKDENQEETDPISMEEEDEEEESEGEQVRKGQTQTYFYTYII